MKKGPNRKGQGEPPAVPLPLQNIHKKYVKKNAHVPGGRNHVIKVFIKEMEDTEIVISTTSSVLANLHNSGASFMYRL